MGPYTPKSWGQEISMAAAEGWLQTLEIIKPINSPNSTFPKITGLKTKNFEWSDFVLTETK